MDFTRYVGEALINSKQHACCVTDLNATFRFVNQAFCDFYGYPEEELIGQTIELLVDKKKKKKAKQQHINYLLKDIEPSQGWEVITKGGNVQRVISSYSRFSHEMEPFMLTILTQLEPDESLSSERLHLEGDADKTNAGRYVYNPSEGIQNWSNGLYEIFRWPKEKGPMPEEEQRKLLKEEDRAILAESLKRCLQKGQPFDHTYTLNFADGNIKYVRSVGELYKDDINTGTLIGILIDITGEIQMRHELERVNRLNNLAVKSGEIGIWEFDMLTGANNTNSMWYEMLGYEKEDVTFTIDFLMGIIHPDDIPIVNQTLEGLKQGAKGVEAVVRLRTKEGSYRWILDTGTVTEWDREGNPLKMAGCHIDITDLKEAEQSLV